MAILAALLIVLAVFVSMDLAAPKTRASAPTPSAQAPVVAALPVEPAVSPAPSPTVLSSAAASAPASPVAAAAPEPTLVATTRASAMGGSPSAAPAEGSEGAKPTVSTQAEGAKRRHHGASASDDIGEFKTSF
jgi:hypothetical protein